MKMKPIATIAAVSLLSLVSTGWSASMIQNKGSDTLVNVAQALAEEYQKVKPEVAIAVTGGGSGTGIAALLNGTVDIANSSRQIEQKEVKLAEKNNIHPKELTIGFDALGVFVHKSNPLKEISLAQLARMYGDGGDVNNWKQLGVEVPGCKGQKIILISRQNNSGTYEYFREAVLHKKDFIMGTRDMHGSKDVVDLVGKTPCAIGYSGMAYADETTKMLAIKKEDSSAAVVPSMETAVDKTYPIARPLFMYTNGEPTGEIKAYLDWIMAKDGQCLVSKKGYAPAKPVPCK
ncbi:phosphate ABC transporter substrate-binding protein [Candidatus Magnetaquicoccus inordinatus]|uniref:phosphate ABC transporter substrate-binding protein n=1 Tax=Candidatus Magnetaquicoccus inordinatus TaxID=2496818 RepID=UPI00102D0651|nr:phosphate ABC transporter substrate-binding protein [Candidatus Magnetaquicoccus inordinatus]